MTIKLSATQELTVKGDTIETVYRNYRSEKYWVNRRYQRKLIWTLDEKRSFIDSIIRGYPVPIILLAENAGRDPSAYEIIDGMQRLNSIVSFLENEFSVDGFYFDLNAMAGTKELLDKNLIKQKTPALDRNICVQIATYSLPVSIFEFSEPSAVDEVFRRINSGGRKLSRQELRTAGATGHFATAVRKIAAQVRGDESYSDSLSLNKMAKVSITNRDLDYGIPVEDIFWVNQNILTKEQVRESRDEEIIADIVAYMVLPQPPASRSEHFDDFYGVTKSDASQKRFSEIEAAVQQRSVELVIHDFRRALDELRVTLEASKRTFGQLMFEQRPDRAPRYFQVVFLAFYKLIIRDALEVTNRDLLISRMNNGANNITIPEGGRWGGDDRHAKVQSISGLYREAFEPASGDSDPAKIHWITQLNNLLSQSLTEQSYFDFKQGFLRLDGNHAFDEESFEKMLKTCAAIACIRKGRKGYVIVGVSDKQNTTERIFTQYNITSRHQLGFSVVGVNHEWTALGKTPDQMFQMITDKVTNSKLSSPLKEYIARHIKSVQYYDKTVYVFETEGQEDVSHYDGEFYDRRGNQLDVVSNDRLSQFIRRYLAGG
ncbi:DUF262 domain-containing protein [Rhodomicrobium lacus]|uniref:DUF262 domain-containing protein n=1 Tax=Rhodomicrobium lacus TaxID=2498452 RepID=UPI000F8E1ED5|nr:DUF262 domain-containing protein [Rhodomicrobium lacus]